MAINNGNERMEPRKWMKTHSKICGEDKRAPEYGEKEKECAGVSGNQ